MEYEFYAEREHDKGNRSELNRIEEGLTNIKFCRIIP